MITYGEVLILVFAVITSIQFISPIIRFRLNVFGNGWGWLWLVICIIITVFLSFVSNAFFCEIGKGMCGKFIGFLCIVVAFVPIIIVYRPVKYSLRNSKTYVQECKKLIICREPKDLISLLNELDISIDIIAKHYVEQVNTADIEKLFNLLVEPHICKLLVKQFPELLSKFIQRLLKTKFGEMDENSIAKSSVRRFLLEIITQAVLDEDSIFYKDYLNNELGGEHTFISLIFGNPGFIQSHLTPLKPLEDISDRPLSNAQVELYMKIQDIVLEKYLNCLVDFKNKDCIMAPLHALINSESAVIYRDPRLEDRETLTYINNVQKYLQVKTIMERLEKAGTQEKIETQEKKKDQEVANSAFEQDLIPLLVYLLHKHFAKLSKIKVKNDRFGTILSSFWMFLDFAYMEGSMGHKIQEKFEEKLFRHLNNMSPIDPDFTGSLINSLLLEYITNLKRPSNSTKDRWRWKLSKRFANFLREHFEISTQRGNGHLIENLPENIRYDAKNKTLYVVPFSREQEESFSLYDHENQQNTQT